MTNEIDELEQQYRENLANIDLLNAIEIKSAEDLDTLAQLKNSTEWLLERILEVKNEDRYRFLKDTFK